MKRFLALFLCTLMLCTVSLAFAEDDFPYEWSQGAEQNDNHFGYVRPEPDNKTHEVFDRLNNFTDFFDEVKPGEKVELVAPKPVGDDLEGLTYSWSMYAYDQDAEVESKEFDYDTDTITTDPMPSSGYPTYVCTVTDKYGNTATCYFDFFIATYEIDPEETEYVKGSGKDLTFKVKRFEDNTGLLERLEEVGFLDFPEEGAEPEWADLSLDHVSENEDGIVITVPAAFLDEYEAADDKDYILQVRFSDSSVYARINITEPIADTDDVTDTALYAGIAVASLVAIVAVAVGKKKLSVR